MVFVFPQVNVCIMTTSTSKFKLNIKPIKDKYNSLKKLKDGKGKSQIDAK